MLCTLLCVESAGAAGAAAGGAGVGADASGVVVGVGTSGCVAAAGAGETLSGEEFDGTDDVASVLDDVATEELSDGVAVWLVVETRLDTSPITTDAEFAPEKLR